MMKAQPGRKMTSKQKRIGYAILAAVALICIVFVTNSIMKAMEVPDSTIIGVATNHVKEEFPSADVPQNFQFVNKVDNYWEVDGVFYPSEGADMKTYSLVVFYNKSYEEYRVIDYSVSDY